MYTEHTLYYTGLGCHIIMQMTTGRASPFSQATQPKSLLGPYIDIGSKLQVDKSTAINTIQELIYIWYWTTNQVMSRGYVIGTLFPTTQ